MAESLEKFATYEEYLDSLLKEDDKKYFFLYKNIRISVIIQSNNSPFLLFKAVQNAINKFI